MQPSASHVEDQVFDDSDGPKHLFTVRNIAIAGTVIILTAGGLGYYYRQELFGVGVVPANTSSVTVPKGYALDLTKEKLADLINKNKSNSFWEFFKSLRRNESFILQVKDAEDKVVDIKVNSIEKLFEEFAKVPEDKTVVAGISEDMFMKVDDKFVLPLLQKGVSVHEDFEKFEDLLKRIKAVVKKEVADLAIDYQAIRLAETVRNALIEEQYPLVLDFHMPKDVKFDIAGYDPKLVSTDKSRNYYKLRFKDMTEYGKARAAIRGKYYDADEAKTVLFTTKFVLKQDEDGKFIIPIKCADKPDVKSITVDVDEMTRTFNEGLKGEYAACELLYDQLYVPEE